MQLGNCFNIPRKNEIILQNVKESDALSNFEKITLKIRKINVIYNALIHSDF